MNSNAADQVPLSVEAKVLIGAFWGVMMTDKVQFDRPWIIHPRTRKGLDELVAGGYLTVETLNDHLDSPMLWRPTAKMVSSRPRVSRGFIEANTFPFTDETQTKPRRKRAVT